LTERRVSAEKLGSAISIVLSVCVASGAVTNQIAYLEQPYPTFVICAFCTTAATVCYLLPKDDLHSSMSNDFQRQHTNLVDLEATGKDPASEIFYSE